jgi:hypothetical protein
MTVLISAGCKVAAGMKRNNEFHKEVRFEVFTAVTMKNAVFWDIKTQFVLHRRHIMSLLQSPRDTKWYFFAACVGC